MQSGKIAFKPKARLVQILGEHLIKDATVGIIELVKNSYDADASMVEITMTRLNTENALITICDNGVGMDLDTFLNKWMNPATGHKEIQKENQIRTKRGRLPLGEKGVGRFATQQIGNKLSMITKVKGEENELVVTLDWKLFGEAEKYLDEVEISYEEIEHQNFKKNESGTILRIFELKSNFTENDISNISNVLKRMKSPFKGAKDFDVKLIFEDCPEEFYKYENLEVSDILEKAHYTLIGIVDSNCNLDFEYKFNVPGEKGNYIKARVNLKDYMKKEELEVMSQPTVCGSFLISIYNYDKSTKWKWLQKSNIVKTDIDELSGVSIYRDGIRILPYGEKEDDWLRLDKRRVQTPSEKINKDNVIGLIEIDQVENKLLIDKTNREGLRENTAFLQFRNLVIATINVLEIERLNDRPEKSKLEKKKDEELKDEVELIRKQLNDIANFISNSGNKELSTKAKIIEEVSSKVEDIEKQYQERQEDYDKRNETLFNLAGTGLAAERFTHEFARLIDGASKSLVRLQNLVKMDDPKIKKELDIIKQSLEALRNDIKLLGPMFYVKKVAKEKELSIFHIIESTINLQSHWLKRENIKTEIVGNNFNVFMREGSCMQIFNNLLDNSIYWLSRKTEIDKKEIRFILDQKNLSVYVSDSGPGIPERNKDKIFDPFVSTKGEDGRGLGLYIVKEILEEKKWGIFVVNQEDHKGLLKGASFKIVFKES